MQPILNVEDVRHVERRLTHEGVSLSELMRRAGSAVAQEVMAQEDVHRVAILAGTGNNGGDGWVAARLLKQKNVQVTVVTPVPPERLSTDLARVAAVAAVSEGVETLVGPPRTKVDELLMSSDVVVDAMLGTGFHGAPAAPFDFWIDAVNECGAFVLSVDVPSGLSAQTGHAPISFVRADMTVTMICLKPGLLVDEGRDACGSIVVAPLASQTRDLVAAADPVAWRTSAIDYIDVMPPVTCAQDKYTRGSVLVVGGSSRYPGAAIMAARAAARSGVGYVTLAVPQPIVGIVQCQLAHIPVVGLPASEDGTFSADARATLLEMASRSSSVLIGPGMGVNTATIACVTALLETKVPLVMDADALNCIARLTSNRLDEFPELIRRTSPIILTPHRAELGRLVGLPDTPPDSLTSAMEAARRIVWANGGSELAVVAKGTATACVGVDIALVPKPGPAALAVAGSGDVLGGIIAGFVAQSKADTSQLPLLCALACETHGYACALAQETYGSRGVIAPDVADQIGRAIDVMEERAIAMATAQ